METSEDLVSCGDSSSHGCWDSGRILLWNWSLLEQRKVEQSPKFGSDDSPNCGAGLDGNGGIIHRVTHGGM